MTSWQWCQTRQSYCLTNWNFMVGRVCDSGGKTEPKSGGTFPVIRKKS